MKAPQTPRELSWMPIFNPIEKQFRAPRERLSARLEAVLEEVGRCDWLVDLCADHARLSIAAVARGQARRALAIDLHQAPLVQARRHLRDANLLERVLLLRGDGLAVLRPAKRGERTLVIAGVGGDLAAQLLERSRDAANADRIVIQPERHAREARAWMRANGFHLASERLVAEGRRLHLILRFERARGIDPSYGAHPLEAELQLGPRLLLSSEPTARAWLAREHARLKKLAGKRADLEPARALLELLFRR